MGGCSVLGCKRNSARPYHGLSFHSYPTEEETLKRWIYATGRTNWEPSKNSRICSAHFEEHCFNRSKKIVYLRPHACPTISIHTNMNLLKREMIPSDEEPQPKKIKQTLTASKIEIEKLQLVNQELKSENQKLQSEIQNFKLKILAENKLEIHKLKLENAALKGENEIVENKVNKVKIIAAKRLRTLKAVRESNRRLVRKMTTSVNATNTTTTKLKSSTKIETENKDIVRRYLYKNNSTNETVLYTYKVQGV